MRPDQGLEVQSNDDLCNQTFYLIDVVDVRDRSLNDLQCLSVRHTSGFMQCTYMPSTFLIAKAQIGESCIKIEP